MYLKCFCTSKNLKGGVDALQREVFVQPLAPHLGCLQGWRQLAGFTHTFDIISKDVL